MYEPDVAIFTHVCVSGRETHFVALRHSMATCIPRVDGLSTDPRVGASQNIFFFIISLSRLLAQPHY